MTRPHKHHTNQVRPSEIHNSSKAAMTQLQKAAANQRRAAAYRAKFTPSNTTQAGQET